jgi:hypothetical protein
MVALVRPPIGCLAQSKRRGGLSRGSGRSIALPANRFPAMSGVAVRRGDSVNQK